MRQMFYKPQSVSSVVMASSEDPLHIIAAVTVCPDWFGFHSDTAVSEWHIATLESQFPHISIAPSACLELLSGFDARQSQTEAKVRDLLKHLVEKSGHAPATVQMITVETAVPDMHTNFWTAAAVCPHHHSDERRRQSSQRRLTSA